MTLADIADQYSEALQNKYSSRLLPGHLKALQAIRSCRTPAAGMTLLECTGCYHRDQRPMSCGHRSCNRCQNTDTSEWLERQRQKLLPVEYFMVTFTLPAQLRQLAWRNQKKVYDLLFREAAETLKAFGCNDKGLNARLGMTGVLHTHSRRLDYHPHAHFVVPGGGINTGRREWRKLKGKYLFNSNNLAKVFRGRLLRALDEAGLLTPELKKNLPTIWVAHCEHVGKGEPALKYLSRYLYRGVISDRQIMNSHDGNITFTYRNSESGKTESRTLKGEDFLWLVLQHVLPKGFRRVRDYGFLHCRGMQVPTKRSLYSLEELAKLINPYVRGWINYYGKFYPSELKKVLNYVEATLVRWAMGKYKKLRGRKRRASRCLGKVAKRAPLLMAHWRIGCVSAVG